MIANPIARAEYARNRERHLIRGRRYYATHKAERAYKSKQYALTHAHKIRERAKIYYAANKERINSRCQRYYLANKHRIAARQKRSYLNQTQDQKDHRRKRMSEYKKRPDVREKLRQSGKRYRAAHPENAHRQWIKCKYNITHDQYQEMLRLQNGVCAICKNGNIHRTRWGVDSVRLVVDHCHTSKKVRGLLCHACNAGLGYFRENSNILKAAIGYLETHISLHSSVSSSSSLPSSSVSIHSSGIIPPST